MKKLTVVTPVIYLKQLKKFIRKFGEDTRLTCEDIMYIYDILLEENITDKKMRRDHVKMVKNKHM